MQKIKTLVNCFSSPFSAVIKFQKQFVDDVIVNVKKQTEELDRHNRERRNREVRLHLDHLEEEYLCCVCGRPGEERETEDLVPDEFSIVHMPSKDQIEQAIIAYGRSGDNVGWGEGAETLRALGPQVYALLGVLSASEMDTRKMVAKVQHALLNQEAAEKQKRKKSSHRDKGLMKIEESDIDMFQQFFKRPVHGYLCRDCHISAKKRLDALTNQIQGILYRGKTPLLRNKNMTRAQVQDGTAPATLNITAPSSLVVSATDGSSACLSDATIICLRSIVRCAVCKRRQASFFVRQSVMFLCQFCCARDRFYRDSAVCINDELMPRETAHLLQSLASHYEKVRSEEEVNALPPAQADASRVDLFSEHNAFDLFAAQAPPYSRINVTPALPTVSSPSERRVVAGNTSVSLFAGKKIHWNLLHFGVL
ncbi:hypothetical protein DQ04_13611010 [Trypanosoma grayi]|uniref:hypothetical protein n=1 Tax=Trypanosoma grayi TaxID=71804 RepID=UPI0004F47C66|nr:hypothetical protein DQ04_13611010 [Trypanosoma grayi]KEG06503.1 hypothetical protein DQ04_13611010 [Trypanosoma grayi]